MALIGFIVLRALIGAQRQTSLFARLAASTLAIQFGLQCAINLAVNLNLIPPKGMTLPFVSYGGTSMIAIAFGMGLMLALTRKRPEERMATGLPAYRSRRWWRLPNEHVRAHGGWDRGAPVSGAWRLPQELRRRGHIVQLMTDHRVGDYGDVSGARDRHCAVGDAFAEQPAEVPARRRDDRLRDIRRVVEARTRKADAVIGFGGYPVFPPFLAAQPARHARDSCMSRMR